MSKDKKVLIVGAGPGGLLLAQFLRHFGIPFEIFERDSELDSRAQGWAVALIACLPDLWELLPTDIGDLEWVSVNEGNSDIDSMTLYDAITGEQLFKFGGKPKGEEGYILRASRTKLRQLFWRKLNVSCNKQFESYKEDENGVEVFFKDGTSTRGSILVGADGARSRVRAQLLKDGDFRTVISSYVAICGEGQLPPEIYLPLRKISNSAILANTTHKRCIFGQHAFVPDKGIANFYYILGYRSDRAEEETAELAKVSKEALYEMATDITKDWQPILRDFIHYIGAGGMFAPPIKFQEFVPPETLPKGRVTLLGDAAHAMMPFRGSGANTTFRDAADLLRALRDAVQNNLDLSSALPKYEEIMLPRGKQMVLDSRAAGQDSVNLMRTFRDSMTNVAHVPKELNPQWD